VLWQSDTLDIAAPHTSVSAMRERLLATGQHRAARLVSKIPAKGDRPDAAWIERATLAVHYELAALGAFLQVPHAMAATLAPLVARVREQANDQAIRVVDIGCGIGANLRHLAALSSLGPGVELVGIDSNPVVVDAAMALAQRENLNVTFRLGNAASLAQESEHPDRTLFISSGLLHHIGPAKLGEFFARHGELRLAAFAHFDVRPGFWARAGGWALHLTRMREPISRHEGLAGSYRGGGGAGRGLIPRPDQSLRPVVGVRL
jgi:SAM-dependent methyltransferase